MIFYIFIVLDILLKLVLWFLILAFGIWVNRRYNLKSLPWLAVYLILPAVIGYINPMLMKQVVRIWGSQHAPPFGWTIGEFLFTWTYFGGVISALTFIVLSIFVFSDIAFHFSESGVELKGWFMKSLLTARERSNSLGILSNFCEEFVNFFDCTESLDGLIER